MSDRIEGSWSSDDEDRPRYDRDTKLAAEYDYHHADGRYSHTMLKGIRADGEKAFLTGRRAQGSLDMVELERRDNPELFYKLRDLEGYLRKIGDEPDLLYRLPELLADMADRPSDLVYIFEGEKEVDNARLHDLIATTNRNGVGKWRPEFSPQLEGRDVVVVPDNDEVGRDHADHIAKSVFPYAKSVRVVELPGVKPKGDLTDWLADGNTMDDFRSVVEKAEPLTTGFPSGGAGEGAERLAPDQFSTNDDGVPYKTQHNARVAMHLMGITLRYDEFAGRHLIDGLPGFGPALDDAALTRMRLVFEEKFRLSFGKDRWFDIATDHARKNSFHPVRDYLDSLHWDGQPRLDNWLVTYGRAEDSEYLRAVSAIVLIAAARRVRVPGCKFDEMLVLESKQGADKSSALAVFGVREDWFTDDCPLNADSKVLIEQLTGRWIVEMGELKGMRRGEVEAVKSMLSRRVDKARLAYGRMTTEQPRQCIFIGTTNNRAYLRDMTGNRRFWPVEVGRFDLAALRRDRDQIWAEAASREASGESIRLPEHLWAVAGEHQAERQVMDPFLEILSDRLEGLEGKVRSNDIWEAVGFGDPSRRTQEHNVRLPDVMQTLGWRRPKSKLRFGGPPQSAWIKGPEGTSAATFVEAPRSVVLGLDDQGSSGRPM